jgi:hypothetical protein
MQSSKGTGLRLLLFQGWGGVGLPDVKKEERKNLDPHHMHFLSSGFPPFSGRTVNPVTLTVEVALTRSLNSAVNTLTRQVGLHAIRDCCSCHLMSFE